MYGHNPKMVGVHKCPKCGQMSICIAIEDGLCYNPGWQCLQCYSRFLYEAWGMDKD